MTVCPSCGEENPERARFCWSCGFELAGAAPSLAEERKIVSVLFVDLVDFTAASENADPEDVRARLRPYHARVKQEIERFGGIVEKFVGDAVMAVFGAPVAHEDDAERAVSAALRIVEAMAELNEEQPGLELAVRGAVNSGEAMVTLAARPAEGEGIVAGDVVNTAARLQQAAPVGGIAVGAATYRATRDLFEYEALEALTAKGKSQPLTAWRPTSPRRRLGTDLEPSARARLIGREDELALLKSTYARALRDASPQLLTVTGEPGVGKTRLTFEFRAWLDDQSEVVFWRQGRSLPYGEGITYWAFGEMVKAHAGILESDTPESAAQKLETAVDVIVADAAERDWVESSLRPLVGAGEATAVTDRDETFTAWRRFVEAVALNRPLVLLFEDLHWADEALIAFIEHLVDWSAEVPLLVLCTARPELFERQAGWGGGKRNSTTISLSPLGTEDTTRLVADLLGRVVLPAETLARLLEHAGGNPLYAEEFVRMLTDEGVLGRGAELRDENIRVPDTVQSLIAARLDTLRPERKALLHDAAVVGKVFWAGALASMGGTDERAVRAGLHELSRKELVRAARSSSVAEQAEYAFSHAIARDVAYAQIPRAERVRKHVAAAEWIEAMARERVTDHAELLAYHYEGAIELSRAAGVAEDGELSRRARRFLELAGDRATSLDLTKARTFYRRALAFHGSHDLDRAQVLVKLALVDPDTLADEQELREALDIYRAHGNELREGWVLVHLAQYAFIHGETARGDELISKALEVLERHRPGEELAAAYTRRAASLALASRPQDAFDTSNKALAIAEELGLESLKSRALQYHGIARVDLGDDGGLDDIRGGLALGHEIADLPSVAFGYSNLGTLVLTRSAREAQTVYDEGVDFCERRGMRGSTMWLRSERTWVLYDLGRWDDILLEVAKVEDWSRELGPGYVSLIALPQKALVLVSRGQLDDATPVVEEFLPRARKARDPQVLQPALTAAALLAGAGGDKAAAAAFVREAETSGRSAAWSSRTRYLPQLAEVAVAADALDAAQALLELNGSVAGHSTHSLNAARAVYVEATGEPDAALTLHQTAAGGWADHGSVPQRARSLFGAGRCLLALGRPHEAASRLREARELYERVGALPSVAALDEALARATSLSA